MPPLTPWAVDESGAALPLYTPPPDPPARRRSPVKLVGLTLGALAMVGATAFAAMALTQSDGAESPEGAVRQLFSSIDHEDALGVIEGLPPGERKVLRDPLIDSSKELQRLGILKKFSLSDVPGADLEVKDLKLKSTPLGDDVVAVDVVGGTISGHSIPADVPIGDALKKLIDDNGGDSNVPDDSFVNDLADNPVHLVAIKEGGGWHVSIAYSLAESIRTSMEDGDGTTPPPPTFGGGPDPVGADSPEGAVKGMVDAAVSLDAEKAITLTDPEEMRALYDYAPLFLPDVSRAAREAKADGDTTVKVDRLDTTVDGDGSVRRVRVTGFDATIASSDSSVHMTYDGDCFDVTSTYTYDYDSYSSSEDLLFGSGSSSGPSGNDPETDTDHERSCASDPDADDGSYSSAFGALGGFGAASQQFGVTVSQVDGRWYVSPMRTILDSAVEGLRKLQPGDIEKWIDTMGSLGSSESDSGSSSFVPIDPDGSFSTTPTTAIGGLGSDPSSMFGPDEEFHFSAAMLVPTATAAQQDEIDAQCASELTVLDSPGSASGGVDGYFVALRDAFGCANGVVPIDACLPILDQVIADGTSKPDANGLGEFYSCVVEATR